MFYYSPPFKKEKGAPGPPISPLFPPMPKTGFFPGAKSPFSGNSGPFFLGPVSPLVALTGLSFGGQKRLSGPIWEQAPCSPGGFPARFG